MDFSKSVPSLDSLSAAFNSGPLGQSTIGEASIASSSIASSSIAFIDSSLADYQGLANSLRPGTDIVILDSSGNELLQITAELVGRSNLSSVSIFSHGSAGHLTLGSTVIDSGSLNSYRDSLQSWSKAFTDGADILLYGCNVGAGDLGESFIQNLSVLTGADIAASTDLTGSQSLGGDWLLESSTGAIETADLFNSTTEPNYQGVLATFLVSNLADNGSAGSLRVALAQANAIAGADTIFFDPSLTGIIALNPSFGALQITDTVTILGPGSPNVAIDAGLSHRVFEVAPVTASIRDLSLLRGLAPASDVTRSGGAILNRGNLALVNTDILNSVAGRGGAVFNNTGAILNVRGGNFTNNRALIALGGTGSGGAIYNNGTLSAVSPTSLVVSLSNFTNNTAERDGGAILNTPGRTASIDSASFEANISVNGFGGAIFNAAAPGPTPSTPVRGVMIIMNSIMQGNAAIGTNGLGGAIANLGTITTDNTFISDGFARLGGGALANLGTLAIATIKNTSLIGNVTNGNGGGIFNDGGRITLRDGSLVTSSEARGTTSRGAGIFNNGPAANFTVRASYVLSNILTSTNPATNGSDLFGAFTTGGFNIIGDSRGSTGFRDGVRGDTVLFPIAPLI